MAAEPVPQILRLNDDCLDEIFDRLQDLPTEVSFARSCQRFRQICVAKWRTCRAYEQLDLDKWREMLPNYEDLVYFLTQMRLHIREMCVSSCLCALIKDLDEMHITELPLVFSFYYDAEDVDCYPSNRSIRKLAQLLPGLRKLRLTTPIDGRYLSHFRHLQELHLYEDQHKAYELQQEYLDEVCHKMHDLRVLDIRTYDMISKLQLGNCLQSLRSLVVLKLNLATLKPILPAVLELPSLKKLVVLLDNEWHIPPLVSPDNYDHKIREVSEFYEIMERKAKDIVGFAVDGYYMPLEPGWDEKLPIWTHRRLKCLAICSWTHHADYLERYTCMTDLQLLCLRNWNELSDDILLRFVELCPKLEHLDVSYCRDLTPNFLPRALSVLTQREPYKQKSGFARSLPLQLYYDLCGFEDFVDKGNLRNSPEYRGYIVFTADFPVDSERGLSFVDRGYQFEFDCSLNM
ncbi:uncharacterized protein LOC108108817 [Drosophila eugracilis]|uniref:uncharacterized protein LOC108108817 n=1 Tax=Drosophila eugracilis TaxID=29029 RepID=UPI0007E7B5BC|nr:uncharacterized protein LOC108108817 [Drosophila eugracilis]